MKTHTINAMSIDELWLLHEQITSVLYSRISAEKAQLEKKLSQLQGAISSINSTRRPYPPVLAKFRNPVRPSETWAGRGKQPRWLLAQLQKGKQLEEFLIRAS
jgi:DNA-binding protein H-NS